MEEEIRSSLSNALFVLTLAYVVLLAGYLLISRVLPFQPWLIDLLDTFALYLFFPTLPLLLLAIPLRSWSAILLSIFPMAMFGFLFGELFLSRPSGPTESGTSFTVMTYNILGMNRSFRNILKLIEREEPDVVAIQELTPEIAGSLVSGLSGKYRYNVVAPQSDFNGVAVFSRFPIKETETFKASASGSLSLHLLLDVHGRDVHLFNLHPSHPHLGWIRREAFPPFVVERFDTEQQMAELELMMEKVEAVDGPLVALGDFNLTDQTRQYRRVTRGLADAFREAGWGLGLTFPANGRMLSLRLPYPVVRIDYVFHSRDLVASEAHLGENAGSDHFPVIAKLSFKGDR